jgi:hypothetical protein
MGVEYKLWMIPQKRSFRPEADQMANLANALREGNWVPKPEADGQSSKVVELLPGVPVALELPPTGVPFKKKPTKEQPFTAEPFTASWIEAHSEHELVLNWSVDDVHQAGVEYPFVFDPWPDSGPPYFCLKLVLSHDYFYHTDETVTPFDNNATRCACKEQLEYNGGFAPGFSSGWIHYQCPKCGRTFDPTSLSCELVDGLTGKVSRSKGGLTFRFALLVDCGKHYPPEEKDFRRFKLRPEFLDLWRTHMQVPFELVSTFD